MPNAETKTTEGEVPKAVLSKVQALIRLANDKPGSEEARTAAEQCLSLMKENKLCLLPLSEVEKFQKRIGEVQALEKKHEEALQQRTIVAGLAGLLASKVIKF